jgi:hypothetical protein
VHAYEDDEYDRAIKGVVPFLVEISNPALGADLN